MQIQTGEPEEPRDEAIAAPLIAARAAEGKKALDIRVFDLRSVSSFTDFFVICSGSNTRQIQAIADEIALQLKRLARGRSASKATTRPNGFWPTTATSSSTSFRRRPVVFMTSMPLRQAKRSEAS